MTTPITAAFFDHVEQPVTLRGTVLLKPRPTLSTTSDENDGDNDTRRMESENLLRKLVPVKGAATQVPSKADATIKGDKGRFYLRLVLAAPIGSSAMMINIADVLIVGATIASLLFIVRVYRQESMRGEQREDDCSIHTTSCQCV